MGSGLFSVGMGRMLGWVGVELCVGRCSEGFRKSCWPSALRFEVNFDLFMSVLFSDLGSKRAKFLWEQATVPEGYGPGDELAEGLEMRLPVGDAGCYCITCHLFHLVFQVLMQMAGTDRWASGWVLTLNLWTWCHAIARVLHMMLCIVQCSDWLDHPASLARSRRVCSSKLSRQKPLPDMKNWVQLSSTVQEQFWEPHPLSCASFSSDHWLF